MVFKGFRINLIFRIILLTAMLSLILYLFAYSDKYVSSFILSFFAILQIIELIHYLESTNRKLTRFLESVRYSDFTLTFTTDNTLGNSFKDLNLAFNEVIEAFRATRKEKEEHFQYLNTIIHHIHTGILSYDHEGTVSIINNSAKKLLGRSQIKNISDLKEDNPELYQQLMKIEPGESFLLKEGNRKQVSINATELKLGGKIYKLIALQNIYSELQQNEVDSWQNLTRVLRHEIMNSITPIASLTSTLNEILREDLSQVNGNFMIEEDSLDDLTEGLMTIENRSKGLANFVDAYRDYTSIPKPKFTEVDLKVLIEHVIQLVKTEFSHEELEVEFQDESRSSIISADEDQLEMVLINLLKNAREAVQETREGKVLVRLFNDLSGRIVIEVIDNGPGIIEEAIDKIFIPFYTTKKKGSGIGLALSRQIIQMHHGEITVSSTPNVETKFTLRF